VIFEDRLGVFEQDAAILETIASQYGHDSRQYLAVRHAAIAL
jgi:hypothetical protein